MVFETLSPHVPGNISPSCLFVYFIVRSVKSLLVCVWPGLIGDHHLDHQNGLLTAIDIHPCDIYPWFWIGDAWLEMSTTFQPWDSFDSDMETIDRYSEDSESNQEQGGHDSDSNSNHVPPRYFSSSSSDDGFPSSESEHDTEYTPKGKVKGRLKPSNHALKRRREGTKSSSNSKAKCSKPLPSTPGCSKSLPCSSLVNTPCSMSPPEHPSRKCDIQS